MALMKMPCAVGTGGGTIKFESFTPTTWEGYHHLTVSGVSFAPKMVFFQITGNSNYYTNVNDGEGTETGWYQYTSSAYSGTPTLVSNNLELTSDGFKINESYSSNSQTVSGFCIGY